ncbi:MAG: FHIPEP family type III secretion protein [Phycisphaerae bacterium]|nr:FHIPEP family type III secretion protein [Phycisphaerae bacterium]
MAYTVGTLCVRIMSDEQPDCQKKPGGVMVARSDFIAVAAAVSLLCGAFVPIPAWTLDIVWGCSLCLSTALVLIGLTGKDPLELSGFPPLMVFGALLRMGLSTATAGSVFRGRIEGTLIVTTGDLVSGLSSVGLLLALPIAAGVVSLLVFRSAGRITATALTCLTETIPENERETLFDEQAGLIGTRRARELEDRALGQTGFYLNMGGAAKLLRCDAVIAAAVILTIVVGQLAIFTLRETMNSASLQECAIAAAGAGIFTLSPMYIVAWVAARLCERTCGYLKRSDDDRPRQPGEIIEIVSQETGRHEQVELLNPDFTEVSAGGDPSKIAVERVAEFQPRLTRERKTAPGCEAERAAAGPEDYYEELAEYVAAPDIGTQPVLLAAATTELLPVTVAVNVGIRLAQRGLRTLLVDAESGREAVAEVFDADAGGMRQGPVATCVAHLRVWGLHAIAVRGASTAAKAIASAAADYDRVIIYAPDLMDQEHRTSIVKSVAIALIFADPHSEGGDLTSFLEETGCGRIVQRHALKTDAASS